MDVVVDLRAVRPARLAASLSEQAMTEPVRELRPFLRGARCEPLPDGVRLSVVLDVVDIASLADEIRLLADHWPFLSYRLCADPPACTLEVTGDGPAGALARGVFAELGD